MKIIKPQRLALSTKVFEDGRESYLVVTAMAFFAFDAPTSLLTEIAMWKFAAEELGKDAALDAGMPKPRGELLLTGKAYPLGGARPACSVRAKLGAVDKTLYAVGKRVWKFGAPSEPEPFTEMAISYENAFGGPEYAENPLGKGMAPIMSDVGEVHPLPNIEDPKQLLQSPGERPALPAGFGPYDLTWPQRFSKMGTYDQAWLKERYPGFAADFELGFFNTAPLDQQIDGYFKGDEAFRLEHLHPSKPVLEGKLPAVRARIFVNGAAEGVALRDVPMRAETVHLFPHAERGILVFRGMLKVTEDDASDVRHLVAGFEALGQPKPASHYEVVLAQRLDRTSAHLYMLRDRDLLPAHLAKAPRVDEADAAPFRDERLFEQNARRRVELEMEKLRESLRAEGLDPNDHMPAELPAEPEVPDLDDLPDFVSRMEAEADAAIADAEKKRAQAMDEARAACAEQGVDLDAAIAAQQKLGGGPPKFSAERELASLREQKALADRAGVVLPHVDAQLADGTLETRLRAAEAALINTYRSYGHYFVPASPLEGAEADAARQRFLAARQAGASFAGLDLTGIDLSNVELSGVNLSGAFLESAKLVGSDLRGADLSNAVLARADLSRAKLSAANLSAANLGSARLEKADLTGGVKAKDAVFTKAELRDADFTGADLTGADLSDAVFAETRFDHVKAPGATFLKSDLTGLSLLGADLSDAVFLEANAAGVDFRNARLDKASFVTVRAEKANFHGAKLDGVRVVKGSTFEGADFTEASLEGALLRDVALRGADFTRARLSGADLSGADLRDAKLRSVVAVGARFVKSNLAKANLSRSDLMDAILQRANLRGALLDRANLHRADMLRVEVDGDTSTKGANLSLIRFVEARKAHG